MKIAFIPIDNRPVCYTLPELISGIDKSIEFSLPPRVMLGSLTKVADIAAIFNWLSDLPEQDAIIISLDTLAYGGLISSRRCPDSFEDIRLRLSKLKQILTEKNAKIYATSSIMRISNNNYNEEEKEYWSLYGKKIFEYSYNICKYGNAKSDIPQIILDDYISTRRRNFEINKIYLEWQREGIFDTLIFSKDDCAEFGYNVMEAKELEALGGFTKTGADEIPLSLLARAIYSDKPLKICPIFLEPDYRHLISNYEDVSLEKSVLGQIELAGCNAVEEFDADILLYVNNFKNVQGEIVMGVQTECFAGNFIVPDRPYMIADVRFANGSDNSFVSTFLKNNITDKNFYGYSAWNTSANTLGSLICGAKVKFLAEKYDENMFKMLQIIRFLDDWAYQANVRQKLSFPDKKGICDEMKPYEDIISKKFDTNLKVSYVYPWERLFEVEIEFN